MIPVIAVYLVLGFLLAWIAGMVAKEEVEVKTGVLVLAVAGVVCLFARVALESVLQGPLLVLSLPVINFGVLTLMLNLLAKLSWKHSAIIAAIYSVIIGALFFGIASCANSA